MEGAGLSILYEDEALLVVDKPAGIHTAPLRAGETGTLLALVLAAFPEVEAVPGLKPVEPGLLHRLDRETSGVVVVARTPAAFNTLRGQFQREETVKEYHAVCSADEHVVIANHLRIESRFAPAGPGRRAVRLVLPGDERKRWSREATPESYVTEASVEKRAAGRALVAAAIRKGFRHQVRAHLAHLGLPILGDPLYGVPAPPGAPQRMYLHASAITFQHPVSGRQLHVRSPLPPEFQEILG